MWIKATGCLHLWSARLTRRIGRGFGARIAFKYVFSDLVVCAVHHPFAFWVPVKSGWEGTATNYI